MAVRPVRKSGSRARVGVSVLLVALMVLFLFLFLAFPIIWLLYALVFIPLSILLLALAANWTVGTRLRKSRQQDRFRRTLVNIALISSIALAIIAGYYYIQVNQTEENLYLMIGGIVGTVIFTLLRLPTRRKIRT